MPGEERQAHLPGSLAVGAELFLGSFGRGLGGSGSVLEGDGDHAVAVSGKIDVGGKLKEALSAHEIGLELGTEGIAAPGDAGGAKAGFAQQGVIDGDTKRSVGRQLSQHSAADDGKDGLEGKAMTGEKTIVGGPIVELLAAGG